MKSMTSWIYPWMHMIFDSASLHLFRPEPQQLICFISPYSMSLKQSLQHSGLKRMMFIHRLLEQMHHNRKRRIKRNQLAPMCRRILMKMQMSLSKPKEMQSPLKKKLLRRVSLDLLRAMNLLRHLLRTIRSSFSSSPF